MSEIIVHHNDEERDQEVLFLTKSFLTTFSTFITECNHNDLSRHSLKVITIKASLQEEHKTILHLPKAIYQSRELEANAVIIHHPIPFASTPVPSYYSHVSSFHSLEFLMPSLTKPLPPWFTSAWGKGCSSYSSPSPSWSSTWCWSSLFLSVNFKERCKARSWGKCSMFPLW